MRGTVVYIDDEPALCRALRMVFQMLAIDARLETFEDPKAALAFIVANDVTLVICDYRMPALSGLEVLDRIERDVPFYVVSGDLDVARFTDSNPRVTGVLAKPYRPEHLLELISIHLGPPVPTSQP